MLEFVLEIIAANNLGAVCDRSSRETRKSAVPPSTGGTVPIPPDKVRGAQEFPEISIQPGWRIFLVSQTLVSAYTSHFRVFKRGEHPGYQRWRP